MPCGTASAAIGTGSPDSQDGEAPEGDDRHLARVPAARGQQAGYPECGRDSQCPQLPLSGLGQPRDRRSGWPAPAAHAPRRPDCRCRPTDRWPSEGAPSSPGTRAAPCSSSDSARAARSSGRAGLRLRLPGEPPSRRAVRGPSARPRPPRTGRPRARARSPWPPRRRPSWRAAATSSSARTLASPASANTRVWASSHSSASALARSNEPRARTRSPRWRYSSPSMTCGIDACSDPRAS